MATKDDAPTGELADKIQQPKKFIRTFAGDAEAIKKGATPDLVPYGDGSKPVVDESVYVAERSVPRPAPPPPAPPAPPPPSVQTEPEPEPPLPPEPQPVIEAAPPPAPPEPEPEPEIAPEPEVISTEAPSLSRSAPSPLETYSSDFSDHVSESGASAITVLAAEQDAARPTRTAPSHTLANVVYIGISLVLLAVGAVGAYGAYRYYEKGRSPVPIVQTVSAPIFVDERTQISGTGEALEQAVARSVASSLAEGAVRLLYTTDATSTDNNIFIDMQLAAPGELVRNIALPGSMAGVTTVSGETSPFFILRVTSYADTFAGMLDWESTMPKSLSMLYPAYQAVVPTASSTVATATTTAVNAASAQPVGTFIDKIVANHNTREYKDASGHTLLLYGYWDQSTLIIARNEAVFTEVVNRLANSKSNL